MPNICLYLHLHQPYRLQEVSPFAVGTSQHAYFTHAAHDENQIIFDKVAHKSYYPMLELLLRLTHELPDFSCAFSTSGLFLEQAERYQPRVITLLQQLAKTGQVEFLAETYYHSLASLYSESEFALQVQQHVSYVEHLFGQTPRTFRNTELIYSNDIAQLVAQQGFIGMLTEGVDRYLHGRDRTQLFASTGATRLPLLLKQADLSDDIAFRFSNKQWSCHPLSVDRYLHWVEVYQEQHFVNLFMDFETFGEHQWADTGIFSFFAEFVHRFLSREWNSFVTPGKVFESLYESGAGLVSAANVTGATRKSAVRQRTSTTGLKPTARLEPTTKLEQLPVYDVPVPISWADVDRDLTAWVDNQLQQDTIKQLYILEEKILSSNDPALISDWRRLQASDHFYYMCTKWSADGDVHAYFSPYDDPYEAYRRFCIALADVTERLL